MTKYAVLIAVEDYDDPAVSPVIYAEADARDFGKALEQHGFDAADQIILVNSTATKSTIESRVRKLLATLAEDDTLYLSYAGHGFSKNGANYITCRDTLISDLAGTSIPLSWFFRHFRNSRCKKIAMFLDSCESGVLAKATMRGIYSDLTDDELKEFFGSAEHCFCFASCKTGEESWPSRQKKHGAWTYHLIEAFNGDAVLALERNSLLTASSLQNYLKVAVPRTLMVDYTDKKEQTPWCFGANSGEFLLADLQEVLARRKAAAMPPGVEVTRLSLLRKEIGTVRRLSGFHKEKGHFVPDSVTDASEAFVARIAADELDQDLKEMHERLKTSFGFKRLDLRVDGPADGNGTIITPYFTYTVDVRLNPDDPSEVVWCRQVIDIKEQDQLFSDAFAKVFGKTFDTLEFSPAARIDVKGLIDRVEDLGNARIRVKYDKDEKTCDLHIAGLTGHIHVTAHSFEVVRESPAPPRQLVQAFLDVRLALVGTHGITMIPFDKK